MKQPIRLTLLLSVTALFATACAPVPFENQGNTYGVNGNTTNYNSGYTAPAPVTAVNTNRPAAASVPEAGPLSAVTTTAVQPTAVTPQTHNASTTHTHAATGNSHTHPGAHASHAHHNNTHHNNGVPTAAPTPTAAAPQVPAANDYTPPTATNIAANNAANHYTPPAAGAAGNGGAASSYDVYGASSNNDPNTSYTTYGNAAGAGTNYAATGGSTNNYYAGSNAANTAYGSYGAGNTGGGNNNYAATSNTSAGGAAVQIFATVSQAKAERIRQDVNSQGLQAIVDQVDGLYKVRVPYPSESQARANLFRVRSVSGTPGAFVTTR